MPRRPKGKKSKLLLRLKMMENTLLSAVEWFHLAQEMRPLTNGSSVICAICGSTWSAQRRRKCQTLTGFAINRFLCGQTTRYTHPHIM